MADAVFLGRLPTPATTEKPMLHASRKGEKPRRVPKSTSVSTVAATPPSPSLPSVDDVATIVNRLATLKQLAAMLTKDLDIVVAGRRLPRVQAIFRWGSLVKGERRTWLATIPRHWDGRPIVPDGRRYLSLEQAAAKAGKSTSWLLREWFCVLDGVVDAGDAAEIRAAAAAEGGSPCK